MSKNDDKILLLKKQIEAKKEELGKPARFAPVTSCSLELDGQRYNLHACNKEQLIFLACKLEALHMAAERIGYAGQCTVSGFLTSEWAYDIQNKLVSIGWKDMEANLKEMEAKLDKLLSEDKKTELELAAIEAMLG